MSSKGYKRLFQPEDEGSCTRRLEDFLLPWFNKKAIASGNDYNHEFDEYLPTQPSLPPLPQPQLQTAPQANEFYIEYVQYPKEIEKRQVRFRGKPNQQRLHPTASKIKLNLIFMHPVKMKEIFKVEVKVHRANPIPNHTNFFSGYATLSNERTKFFQEEPDSSELVVLSDLDSVYEINGQKLYELSKVNSSYNVFELLVEVYFHNCSKSFYNTDKFLVVGTKQEPREKKSKVDEVIINEEVEQATPRSNGYFKDPSLSDNFASVQKMVTDIIEARQGSFGELYAKVIKSGNGDIAYHFVLSDQYSHDVIEAGEIIGFTLDTLNKVVIHKLTLQNSKDVFLKGVVTDSQYLECNQSENEKTATVCMLGLVRVNVIGSVYQGDGLYASPRNPGVAISGHFIKQHIDEHDCRPALIGHAFQKVECDDDTLHQVQALVSLTDSAGFELMNKQLNGLESRLKINIADTAKRNKKKIRKCMTGCVVVSLLFSILVTILIYQLNTPGSAYMYWKCRRASNGGTSHYWYWLKGKAFHGIEFNTCSDIWEKATERKRFHRLPKHHEQTQTYQCLNDTFHYYINLDSCAGVINAGARYLYAVDDNCTSVWQFDELRGKWKRDKRICSLPKCNVVCSFNKGINDDNKCDIDDRCVWDEDESHEDS